MHFYVVLFSYTLYRIKKINVHCIVYPYTLTQWLSLTERHAILDSVGGLSVHLPTRPSIGSYMCVGTNMLLDMQIDRHWESPSYSSFSLF